MSLFANVSLLALAVLTGPGTVNAKDTAVSARSVLSKADIFGSPTLVPTREGERARRELSLSGEAVRLLSTVPSVMEATLTVQLGSHPTVVGVVVTDTSNLDSMRREMTTLTSRATGIPESAVQITMEQATRPSPSPSPTLPLGLAIFGLGTCIGILVERWRWRRVAMDDRRSIARYR